MMLDVSVMKVNALLLLLAVICSQLAPTDTQSIDLASCPISIFGKMQDGSLNINQANDFTEFCFMSGSTIPEYIEISGADAFTVATESGNVTDDLQTSVQAALPQLANGSLSCFWKITFSTDSQLNMTVMFLSFGSQTALSVQLMSYGQPNVLVRSLDAIGGFNATFTQAEGEATKYLDLSGCRIMGQVVFPASDRTISENCTDHTCSAQGEITTVSACGSKETCAADNTCQPVSRVCTVSGGQVIQFFGQVSSITDRCMYSLLEPAAGSDFVVLAAFKDRRSQTKTFLERLDLMLSSSNVTISLETSGKVQVNGEIQMLESTPTDVQGVQLSRSEAGVTLEISSGNISPVDISIFFDGSTAYITVPDGGTLMGLCGNPSDPTYSATPTADSRSELGCETMPQANNLIVDSTLGIQRCSLLEAEPFTTCHSKVSVAPYVQTCNATLSDYPMKDNLDCQFFEVYARVCNQQYDIDLGDWRASVGCPSTNQAYCQNHDCGANEFCGESPLKKTACLCRAIYASEYKSKNVYGDPPVCQEGRGSISLIGCLLEEKGIDYTTLHLKSENCTGQRDSETHLVTFNFDSSNTCGTETERNNSFVVLKNSILLGHPVTDSIITRTGMLEVDFTCTYKQPKTKDLSLHVTSGSVMRQLISQEQNYTLVLEAFTDSGLTELLDPDTDLELNQQIWIDLRADGLNGSLVKLVTESCWVTQKPMPNDTARYDLIIDGCPNPKDDTVEINVNGEGNESSFTFRMFQFVDSVGFYLHCTEKLCAMPMCKPDCSQNRRRRRRALKNSYENFPGDLISMEWRQ
ncbi:alpha-tectorin-like [Syngnathus scovelli]|uniref:alpha-tectorin-like n=1 Tax=Syngnathus scovelli TaxID=161590 RepID=UPI00210FC975|nr:alpha-tectorin-like [Syngnathus scovelli]